MSTTNLPVAGLFYELGETEQNLLVRAMKCGAMSSRMSNDEAAQHYLNLSEHWFDFSDNVPGETLSFFATLLRDVESREADPEQAKWDDEEFARGFDEAHAASENAWLDEMGE